MKLVRFCGVICLSILLLASCSEGEEAPPPSDSACTEGMERCGDDCVDTGRSAAHCGGCDQRCDEGLTCVEGTCTSEEPTCPRGQETCDGSCVDTSQNAEHCGACGFACGTGESCEDGQCEPSPACDEDQESCGEDCVDTQTHDEHCGACFNDCLPEQECVAGVCTCPAAGQEACDSACRALDSDPLHCGECGLSCLDRANATEGWCDEGSCVLECETRYDNCDGEAENGCESELASDARNCGECGIDCFDSPQVEVALCLDGACEIARCEPGWEDCDLAYDTGCEIRIDTDVEHCGACDFSCVDLPNNVAAPECIAGECKLECAKGWEDCDGLAANGCEMESAGFASDPMNCGGCGVVCEEGYFCIEGACTPDYEIANWPLPPDRPTAYAIGKESVEDLVTGLVWQKVAGTQLVTWQAAVDACSKLDVDGQKDWRLPSIIELATLIDTTTLTSFLNEDAFGTVPGGNLGRYWSTTPYPHSKGVQRRWAIQLNTGPEWFSQPDATTASAVVRCVRAGKSAPGPRFIVGENSVEDPRTGLVWQRSHARGFPPDAESACAKLSIDGRGGWRLPTVKELLTLVDPQRLAPSIDLSAFPDTPGENFWTSTPVGFVFAAVSFEGGWTDLGFEDEDLVYRCVREAD